MFFFLLEMSRQALQYGSDYKIKRLTKFSMTLSFGSEICIVMSDGCPMTLRVQFGLEISMQAETN